MRMYLLLSLLLSFSFIAAQDKLSSGGGAYNLPDHACLSEMQRAEIISTLQQIYKETPSLQAYGSHATKMTSFSFPVRAAENLENDNFYSISNFVDHNQNSSGQHNNFVRDYDCGNRSYDLGSGYDHSGTDIFPWPFSWKKMDDDAVEVIAADEGMIIFRVDGNYDRNCTFCTNCQWNAVYLMHANGNVSWYGHLKENSVTEKNTGDIVEKGEYLGIVGSSGSSTGPHLHFEIWENNNYNNLLDPYEGICNTLNDGTMWDDQEAYRVPGIMEMTTSTTNPMPQGCGEQWVTNLSDDFAPGERIYFSAYFRDQLNNEAAQHSVFDAEGTLVDSWLQQFSDTFHSSWWWFTRVYGTSFAEGIWTYEVVYLDEVKLHEFTVGQVSNVEDKFVEEFSFVNNNASRSLQLVNKKSDKSSLTCSILNSAGQILYNSNVEGSLSISTIAMTEGVYFLHISDSESNRKYTRRFLVF